MKYQFTSVDQARSVMTSVLGNMSMAEQREIIEAAREYISNQLSDNLRKLLTDLKVDLDDMNRKSTNWREKLNSLKYSTEKGSKDERSIRDILENSQGSLGSIELQTKLISDRIKGQLNVFSGTPAWPRMGYKATGSYKK